MMRMMLMVMLLMLHERLAADGRFGAAPVGGHRHRIGVDLADRLDDGLLVGWNVVVAARFGRLRLGGRDVLDVGGALL